MKAALASVDGAYANFGSRVAICTRLGTDVGEPVVPSKSAGLWPSIVALKLFRPVLMRRKSPSGLRTPFTLGLTAAFVIHKSHVATMLNFYVGNKIHPALRHATETPAPIRNESWYRALQ